MISRGAHQARAPLRRGFGRHPASLFSGPVLRSPTARQDGGDGGIRTLDRALQPYNGLANRRLQPLGHVSCGADMPDAASSRKWQMRCGAALRGTLVKDTHAGRHRTAVSRTNGSPAARQRELGLSQKIRNPAYSSRRRSGRRPRRVTDRRHVCRHIYTKGRWPVACGKV